MHARAGTVVQQSGGEREEKGVATSADLVADRPRVVFILGGPGSGVYVCMYACMYVYVYV